MHACARAGTTVNLCLAGLVAAVRCSSLLGMDMLRRTFVTTVARFTQLHAPAGMALKHAQAFRALLVIADENGNHLGVRVRALIS
jgi:brefeldin A-inhibited guanine nucleotide-exchange protein